MAAQDALDLGKLIEIKVPGISLHRSLYVAWNKNRYQSYSVKAFLNFLKV